MKNVLLFMALLSASFALQAQTPCLGCPKQGASTPVVASRPLHVAAEIPALPRFDITGARYFWNYNGDRKGKWADVRITCAEGKVTVQTPYAGYIFNLEGAQYKAIDDVHEYRFVNGAATLDLEFMQDGGAIDYIRLIVGDVGSNTHMEWFPEIFSFIQFVKS
jgi:hypothetical protein